MFLSNNTFSAIRIDKNNGIKTWKCDKPKKKENTNTDTIKIYVNKILNFFDQFRCAKSFSSKIFDSNE